jgi:hypothetical protein
MAEFGLRDYYRQSRSNPEMPVKSAFRQVRFSLDVNRARLELIPSTLGVYEPPLSIQAHFLCFER